ncbi:MAG: hypothetical protein SGBAC_008095 [Bacillariaceae sp.]
MNFEKYPWLADLSSPDALAAINKAQQSYQETGATIFPNFLTPTALEACIQDARAQESTAFTTDDVHTAYLRPINEYSDPMSVENLEMRTQVASIAYDELPTNSVLGSVYEHPTLRRLISKIVGKEAVFLSDDSLGCCSINVFRPGYHHSFHFDESEFSCASNSFRLTWAARNKQTTLMLQESETPGSGLFQYTKPLRDTPDDLALSSVANAIHTYANGTVTQSLLEASLVRETKDDEFNSSSTPSLHTLDFVPGTLSIFAGSKSLHRVTQVEGGVSRLVAVFTFASQPGFQNTPAVQTMFWGRSSSLPRGGEGEGGGQNEKQLEEEKQ